MDAKDLSDFKLQYDNGILKVKTNIKQARDYQFYYEGSLERLPQFRRTMEQSLDEWRKDQSREDKRGLLEPMLDFFDKHPQGNSEDTKYKAWRARFGAPMGYGR